MHIRNIQLKKHERYTQISADIGPFPLWFRFNSGHETDPYDATPFLISATIPAMLLGKDLVVDKNYYVSERLINNLPEIMTIFNLWNPIFKRISIKANTKADLNPKKDCASFFSAGVDSVYTALKHQNEIATLILINGFDFNMKSEAWQTLVSRNSKLAAILNKKLLLVETNLKEFTSWFGLKREANFGASLASIANLLDFSKVHISGSSTFDSLPKDGSHPLVDPLWSTEVCNIVHTGLEADRSKKIDFFKNLPEVYSKLWVCWNDPKTNCGKCSKCIRSYIAMTICGIDDFEFQNPVTMKSVRRISIDNDDMLTFYKYFEKYAESKELQKLRNLIRRKIVKYKAKLLLKDIDTCFLNSTVKKVRRFGKSTESSLVDIGIYPRDTDILMLGKVMDKYPQNSVVNSEVDIGSEFN